MSIEGPERIKPVLGGVLSSPGAKGVLQQPEVGSGLQLGPPEAAKGEAKDLPREGEAGRGTRAAIEGMLARIKAEDIMQERAADDGLVDVRKLERDVRALEREVAELKRRMAELRRPGV